MLPDENKTSDGERRVVAAANRLTNGVIVCGVRHWDMLMHLAVEHMQGVEKKGAEQGFVNSYGEFLTREEAWSAAKVAGQLLPRAPTDGTGGRLYSEDVW